MRAATIHYLTVQDLLWINQEITGEESAFKYAQLEETAGFQYGYGKSKDVLGQAGTFLQGFLKMRPFSQGNRKTAFIATLAFLNINGYEVNLEPASAVSWTLSVANQEKTGFEAVTQVAIESNNPPAFNPALRSQVRTLIQTYSQAMAQLED